MELLVTFSILIVPFLLPFVVYIVFICLPVRKPKKIEPVETEEIFDHLFIENKQKVRVMWTMKQAA